MATELNVVEVNATRPLVGWDRLWQSTTVRVSMLRTRWMEKKWVCREKLCVFWSSEENRNKKLHVVEEERGEVRRSWCEVKSLNLVPNTTFSCADIRAQKLFQWGPVTLKTWRLQGMITEGKVQTLGCVLCDVTTKCQATQMMLRHAVTLTWSNYGCCKQVCDVI